MPGTFTFKPLEANLTHDTDWLGKMDPYCSFVINNKRVKSQVCKSGGQHPIWNDTVTIPLETDQPACVVELMDKDKILPDDSIGTFVIDLKEVQNKGLVSKWYPLYHKNKPAGEILLEASFQSGQQGFGQNQPYVGSINQPFIGMPLNETPLKQEAYTQQSQFTQIPSQGISGSHQYSEHNFAHSSSLEDPLYGKTIEIKSVTDLPGRQFTENQYSGTQNVTNLSGRQFTENQYSGSQNVTNLPGGQFTENQYSGSQNVTDPAGSQFTENQYSGSRIPGSQRRNQENLLNQEFKEFK